MNNRMRDLLERADFLTSENTPRRREDLVERAVNAGHSTEYANRIYDLADEEAVDPAVAFELVLNRIGVRELAPPNEDNWEETQVEAPPFWVADADVAPEAAARERHLRTTFRRLRSKFDEEDSPRAALEAFLREPDVDEMEY